MGYWRIRFFKPCSGINWVICIFISVISIIYFKLGFLFFLTLSKSFERGIRMWTLRVHEHRDPNTGVFLVPRASNSVTFIFSGFLVHDYNRSTMITNDRGLGFGVWGLGFGVW